MNGTHFAVTLNILKFSVANEPRICSQKCTLQYISPFLSGAKRAQSRVRRTPEVPHGISRVYILYALAKQGQVLGAYKLARTAFHRTEQLVVPAMSRKRSWRAAEGAGVLSHE